MEQKTCLSPSILWLPIITYVKKRIKINFFNLKKKLQKNPLLMLLPLKLAKIG
jgi:hypothetical protein